ncbi:MAG: hypothetical protein IJY65_03910 [Clostridia bacterium]|nr:hypothetical protein [Clostridia bacterium]
MKKILAILLLIALTVSTVGFLYSCGASDGNNGGAASGGDSSAASGNESGGSQNGGNNDSAGGASGGSTIVVPEYKDYGRATVDFDQLAYSRPNMAKIFEDFDRVIAAIEADEKTLEELLEMIVSLEEGYTQVISMSAFANICLYRDMSNKFWSEEDAYISQNYATFSQKVEELFVAAANSPKAEEFEEKYFGDGLIEEYKDGGIYTDEIVELMDEEAKLESDYESISTATVVITYGDITDTYDNVIEHYKQKYGENSTNFESVVMMCDALYSYAARDAAVPIFIDLIKVRRLIADELELDSYMELAYDKIYHDYTVEEMDKMLDDISAFAIPVYKELAYSFSEFMQTTKCPRLATDKMMNTLYTFFGEYNTELSDIYNYMLQHKLYDVSTATSNRFDGAFTSYIQSNNSPFIFVSTNGGVTDYLTVIHEFGHFADAYMNNHENTSLDLNEVSSTALEHLALIALKDHITDEEYQYLRAYQYQEVFESLITQGFFARFEMLVYELDYEEIDETAIATLAITAASEFSMNITAAADISNIMIPHIVLYPSYVQSYCTSRIVALQLYFEEVESSTGLEAYLDLIDRENPNLSFVEYLEAVGLESPFEEYTVRDLSDKIYFEMTGRHFFKESNDTDAA